MIETSKGKLLRMTMLRGGILLIAMSSLFFLTAGTLRYWHAWILLSIFFIPMLIVLLYLIRKNPMLIERRMRIKEQTKSQRLCITLSTPFFVLGFVIAGLDYRFSWSSVPVGIVIIADILILLGYVIVFLVFRENAYASRIVDVEKDQKVVSSGPYAVVRHPMYVGVILMYNLSPLALGSFWAILPMLIIPVVIIIRIFDEEKLLIQELPGYVDYMQKVRYRLIPKIW